MGRVGVDVRVIRAAFSGVIAIRLARTGLLVVESLLLMEDADVLASVLGDPDALPLEDRVLGAARLVGLLALSVPDKEVKLCVDLLLRRLVDDLLASGDGLLLGRSTTSNCFLVERVLAAEDDVAFGCELLFLADDRLLSLLAGLSTSTVTALAAVEGRCIKSFATYCLEGDIKGVSLLASFFAEAADFLPDLRPIVSEDLEVTSLDIFSCSEDASEEDNCLSSWVFVGSPAAGVFGFDDLPEVPAISVADFSGMSAEVFEPPVDLDVLDDLFADLAVVFSSNDFCESAFSFSFLVFSVTVFSLLLGLDLR